MALQRILIVNAKGGCGKTTITTNIASHYAAQTKDVRLFDHDSQGSSLAWLARRPPTVAPIAGVDASKSSDTRMTRSWQLRVPPETDVAIIDTPAGIDIYELAAMLQERDTVIIPVLPSPIDIHAAAHFIGDLLTTGKARKRMIRMGVVANRVRKNNHSFHNLEKFLFSLSIPFITSLRDTQMYAAAIEQGVGIAELSNPRNRQDKEQWSPLFRWIEAARHSTSEPPPVTRLFDQKSG